MSTIHLLTPDSALREAITEQLAPTELGAVQTSAGLPEEPFTEPTAILIDEAACDAKTVKKLNTIKNDKNYILFLGKPPSGLDDSLIAEIFAKPFRLGHLIARLRFYIEVAPRLRSAPVAIGPYRFEAQQRRLVNGDDTIRLTEKESALLEYLAQAATPVGRGELLAAVWGYDARIDTHTLETHIYQLRRKLGGDKKENELIINENGLYRLGL